MGVTTDGFMGCTGDAHQSSGLDYILLFIVVYLYWICSMATAVAVWTWSGQRELHRLYDVDRGAGEPGFVVLTYCRVLDATSSRAFIVLARSHGSDNRWFHGVHGWCTPIVRSRLHVVVVTCCCCLLFIYIESVPWLLMLLCGQDPDRESSTVSTM